MTFRVASNASLHINSRVMQMNEIRYCTNIVPIAMIVQVCL